MSYGFVIKGIDEYVNKLNGLRFKDLSYRVYGIPYYTHDEFGNNTVGFDSYLANGYYDVVGDELGFMGYYRLSYDDSNKCEFDDDVWYCSRYLDMLVRYCEALRVMDCEVVGRSVTGRYIWRYPYCSLPVMVRGLLSGRGKLYVCDIEGFEMNVLCEMYGLGKIRFEDYGVDRAEGKENFYRYIYCEGGIGYSYVGDDGMVWAKGRWWDKVVLDRLDREFGDRLEGEDDIHNKVQRRCSELFDKLLYYLGSYKGFRLAYHLHDEFVVDSEYGVESVFNDIFWRLYKDCGVLLRYRYDERDVYGKLLC